MWQKCPICNGTGESVDSLLSFKKCSTCKGAKIIHTITGLPPAKYLDEDENKDNPNLLNDRKKY